MNQPKILIFLVSILLMTSCGVIKKSNKLLLPSGKKLNYVKTPKVDTINTLHGVEVADPYRWLENSDSYETKTWVDEQNENTDLFFEEIGLRDKISNRLKKFNNKCSSLVVASFNGNYIYYQKDRKSRRLLYYITDDLNKKGELLLDPQNDLDPNASIVDWIGNSVDDNVAILYNNGSSSSYTIRIINLKTKKFLSDLVNGIRVESPSWKNNEGLYYSKYPMKEDGTRSKNLAVYFHKLGDKQSQDKIFYQSHLDGKGIAYAKVYNDPRFLALYQSLDFNCVKIYNLEKSEKPVFYIKGDESYSLVGSRGNYLYFLTKENAPNGKLIRVDLNNSSRNNWKDIIYDTNASIEEVHLLEDRICVKFIVNAHSNMKFYDYEGGLMGSVGLPDIGTIKGIFASKEKNIAYYYFTSYTKPFGLYKLNIVTGTSTPFNEDEFSFDTNDFKTDQVWFTSKDGTRVPMFIVSKRDLVLNGNNPTLINCYGGFGIPLTPKFKAEIIAFIEQGGIYAVPSLRGGGEFGLKWHDDGRKYNKKNTFDDLISAAEYLIYSKYTRKGKIAINGRSNGGLTIAASLLKRPDLFKVAILEDSVLDMLRFHKFTIGWAWVPEYLSAEEPEGFKYLLNYSPVHNVKKTSYPATLIYAADKDETVVPLHSYKFAAELQEKQLGKAPVLVKVSKGVGHGIGSVNRFKRIVDKIAFIMYNMGIKYKEIDD